MPASRPRAAVAAFPADREIRRALRHRFGTGNFRVSMTGEIFVRETDPGDPARTRWRLFGSLALRSTHEKLFGDCSAWPPALPATPGRRETGIGMLQFILIVFASICAANLLVLFLQGRAIGAEVHGAADRVIAELRPLLAAGVVEFPVPSCTMLTADSLLCQPTEPTEVTQ